MKECVHCGRNFKPRVKGQEYCSKKNCQRARRALWQRNKMAKDQDYKDNKMAAQKDWLARHPGYYKDYRDKHPAYVKRNRLLQLKRNAKRRKDGLSRLIAKLDVWAGGFSSRKGGLFKVVPCGNSLVAKKNLSVIKLIPYKGLGSYG